MQNFDTLIPLALAEADRLIARQPARDVAREKGKQSKKQDTKRKPKQMRLAIKHITGRQKQ